MGDSQTFQAVIFDFGGVLMRTEDKGPRTQLARRMGRTYAQLEEVVFNGATGQPAALGQLSAEQHWSSVAETLQISQTQIPAFQEEFWGGDRMDLQLLDRIRRLKGRYRTALLSNAWSDLRDYLENRWKIADAFDLMVISAEVGLAKPDPRIYHLVLERLQVPAQAAIFLDDVLENVEAAQSVGLTGIQFRSADQALTDLDQILNGAGKSMNESIQVHKWKSN
jgi:epoxide hydrolase-like predicted phosphatase